MADKIINEGGEIKFNCKVSKFYNDNNKIYSVVLENGEEIKYTITEEQIIPSYVRSSFPYLF